MSNVRTCEICSKPFPERRNGKSDANRCCSRTCGFELQRREREAVIHWYFRNCAVCSLLFRMKNKRQVVCDSDECRAERERRRALAVYRQRQAKLGPTIAKHCKQCQRSFTIPRIMMHATQGDQNPWQSKCRD